MGKERSRSRILDLCGGYVAGGEALLLGELKQVVMGLAVEVNADGAVVGLDAGSPLACRGC